MNALRMISRVLVVAAVVFAGNVCLASEAAKAIINNNKATLGAIALGTALPEDADAAKAALETAGVTLDQVLIKGAERIDPCLVPVNFAANVVARKIVRCFDANGFKLPNPDLGKAGNHVNRPLRDAVAAAAPQVIAGLVVMAVCK